MALASLQVSVHGPLPDPEPTEVWWYRMGTGGNFDRLVRSTSATSPDAVNLRGGDVEVSPIHLRTPLGRKSKIQFGLGGGDVLHVVPSMEASSWEVLLFGGEMLWVMDSA